MALKRKLPKFFTKEKSVRERSGVKERKVAKQIKAQVTVNSGATFGQNDLENKLVSIEHKFTSKKSFSIKAATFKKAIEQTPVHKVPAMFVDFENEGLELVVVEWRHIKEFFEEK